MAVACSKGMLPAVTPTCSTTPFTAWVQLTTIRELQRFRRLATQLSLIKILLTLILVTEASVRVQADLRERVRIIFRKKKLATQKYYWRLIKYFCFLVITGVISAGVSVPVQIPSQTPDSMSNYWPRIQWSQLFGFPPPRLLVENPATTTNTNSNPTDCSTPSPMAAHQRI